MSLMKIRIMLPDNLILVRVLAFSLLFGLALLSLTGAESAKAETGPDTYQAPAAFLKETFGGEVPDPSLLWLTKDIKPDITRILGHPLRNWRREKRSVWILEEIGKEEPITTGIVVNGGRIEQVKVLVFRESRGWEVRYPFFTDQFRQAALTPKDGLDREIDGISGATLSVNAVTRLARLALYFDKLTSEENE